MKYLAVLALFLYLFPIGLSINNHSQHMKELKTESEMFNFVRKKIEWMETGSRHYWKNGELKIGPCGEIGIRQVTMKTAEWIHKKFNMPGLPGDISNRETNIIYSDKFILWMRSTGMDWEQVASCYNFGPNNPAINVIYLGCIMGSTNYLNGKQVEYYWKEETHGDKYPVYNL